MKKPLVVGNWKMYIESPEEAKKYILALRRKSRLFSGVGVVIAPPFPLIATVVEALKGSTIKVGAQSLSPFIDEKRTGEVSATMLKNTSAQFVIVGHSERRAQGESEESIEAQVHHAVVAGLATIVCVGEGERDTSGSHFSIIAAQIASALKNFPKNAVRKLIIAYEPVWAIGKSASDAMRPTELREMSIFIRKSLTEQFERKAAMRVPILYGGSVEGENARALMTEGDVGGFLVGHASAQTDSFLEILTQCKK